MTDRCGLAISDALLVEVERFCAEPQRSLAGAHVETLGRAVMNFCQLGVRVGLALSGFALGAIGAIAPPPPLLAQTATPAAPTTAESVTFQTFAVPELFVIEMPLGWFADAFTSTDGGTALITSYDPNTATPTPADIKTDITIVGESPDVYVGQALDALVEQGYVLDRYGITSIGGNDAFRIWIVQLPGEFANQVITFVGHVDGGTAKLVSSYNDDSQATKDLILQMHGSFDFATTAE